MTFRRGIVTFAAGVFGLISIICFFHGIRNLWLGDDAQGLLELEGAGLIAVLGAGYYLSMVLVERLLIRLIKIDKEH